MECEPEDSPLKVAEHECAQEDHSDDNHEQDLHEQENPKGKILIDKRLRDKVENNESEECQCH